MENYSAMHRGEKDATYRAARQYGFIFIFNRTAIFFASHKYCARCDCAIAQCRALSASAERFTSCESASLERRQMGCCNKVRVIMNKPCCPRSLSGCIYAYVAFPENTAKRCENGKMNYRYVVIAGWLTANSRWSHTRRPDKQSAIRALMR